MRHILLVAGTRPEAIKLAPLVRRLRSTGEFSVTVCSTGQHREMIHQAFRHFSIVPDIDLNVMAPEQSLGELTQRVIRGMEEVIRERSPDRILVQGDTTTTFSAALAAYYHKVPVGHVEAGLRTGDIYAPWPEELNRRLTDAIADRHYAPTTGARDNLLREGVAAEHILVTGNTGIDALFDILRGPLSDSRTQAVLRERFSFLDGARKKILVTCHRRESFGDGFRKIAAALSALAARDDIQIVFPVHLNPNVLHAFRPLERHNNIHIIEPVDYLEFVFLLSICDCVLTDSGGVQEEAPSLGVPVLVMRDKTERPEAIAVGAARLVGVESASILRGALDALEKHRDRKPAVPNPYGDGEACSRIVASLLQGCS